MDKARPDQLIREPMVDELWYPGDPVTLQLRFDAILRETPALPYSPAWILPVGPDTDTNAVYARLGRSLCAGSPKRVMFVVLYNHGSRTKLILPESTRFSSVLGQSTLDAPAASIVVESTMISLSNDLAHLEDTSFELPLTWFHHLGRELPILPLIGGPPGETVFRSLAGIIRLMELESPTQTLYCFMVPQNQGLGPQFIPMDAIDNQGLLNTMDIYHNLCVNILGLPIVSIWPDHGISSGPWSYSFSNK